MGEDVLRKFVKNRTGPSGRSGWKILSGVIISMMLICSMQLPVFAAPSEDGNVEKPEETNVSLYDTQTALSTYVNDVLGVNGNDKHHNNRVESTTPNGHDHVVGNAGAYVGYGDEDAGFHSFIMSNVSYGVSSSTYDAWMDVTSDDGTDNQVYAYVRYGRLLRATGLDSVAGENHSSFRGIAGMLSTVAFALAQLIPLMFGLVLKVLKLLNPFGFLSNAQEIGTVWRSWLPSAPSQLTAMVDFISGIFDTLVHEITWLVAAPLLLLVAISQVLMFRQPAGSTFMKYGRRIVFFVIGIPLCAGLYTNVINEMFDIMTHNTASAQVVASTVIDFESWCDKSQLAVPDGVILASAPGEKTESGYTRVDGGVPTDETLLNLRKSTYVLNKKYNSGLSNLPDVNSIDSVHFTTSANMWNGNITPGAGHDESSTAFAGMTSLTQDFKVTGSLLDMLWRYTSQSFYRPTDFETKYMNLLTTDYRVDLGHMGSTSGASSNAGKVYEMFDRTNDVEDWMERNPASNRSAFTGIALDKNQEDGHHMQWVDQPFNIYRDGSLKVSSYHQDDVMTYTTESVSIATPNGEPHGLSTQSMYNFLCTSFDENSLMVYSGDRSVSELSRQLHYSTNIIGTGVLQFVFGLNMIVLMGVMVIIAFAFSLKMMIHNLKKGISLLASIPMAMVGVVKSIAQVISYTFAMILELIVTAFLYVVVSDVMVMVALAVESVVSVGLSSGGGTTVTILASIGSSLGLSTEAMIVAAVIVEMVLVTGLLMFAWKYRKVWFYARHQLSNRMYRCMTLRGMESVYESGITGLHKDVWKDTGRESVSFPGLVKGYLQVA